MAEDHGLSNGDGPVDITQGLELLISAVAQDVILLDGVQCLLLTLQFDDVRVGHYFLGKFPDRVFKGGREKQHLAVPGQHPALPLDADALILVALSGYHHVSLIQNKHLDLLGVDELELGAPVQNGPRGANDNVLTDFLTSFHCGDKMCSFWMKFAHLFNHFSCLQRQLIRRGEAQTLTGRSQEMSLEKPCGS
uniref:Uncharacterized protein n=1 Tax=Capra hircus TaxID=9925 RepID=A0A452F713_CAPHI